MDVVIATDHAVRVTLGISLATAAKLAGVSHPTLRLYEVSPAAVKGEQKRASCARLYSLLRELLARAPARAPGAKEAA